MGTGKNLDQYVLVNGAIEPTGPPEQKNLLARRWWLFLLLGLFLAGWFTYTRLRESRRQRCRPVLGAWEGVMAGGEKEMLRLHIGLAGLKLQAGARYYRDGAEFPPIAVSDVVYKQGRLRFRMDVPVTMHYLGRVADDGAGIEGRMIFADGGSQPLRLRPIAGDYLQARPDASSPLYHVPEDVPGDWPVASCSEEGLDRARIEDMVRAIIKGRYGTIHSVLVVRRGRLVVEEYFFGHHRGQLHHLYSITKSVTSLLVGMAMDRLYLSGVDQRVIDLFPAYRARMAEEWGSSMHVARDWQDVRLKHLLTMTSGISWSRGAIHELLSSTDPMEVVFSRPVAITPGKMFRYNDADMQAVAGIIKQATGLYADDFAREYLFGPLGITHFSWTHMDGNPHPHCHGTLCLTPRDMAKIGQLVLDRGTWQGRRLLSANWLQESAKPRERVAKGLDYYGYLWWLEVHTRADGPNRVLQQARGVGSQFIVLCQDQEIVVVITGNNFTRETHFLQPLDMIDTYILPQADGD